MQQWAMRTIVCGLLVLLGSAAIGRAATGRAEAEPPRVVAMSPENGDVDVDPALTHIRVTFDTDMVRGGRSICGGGPTFPTITGEPEGWPMMRKNANRTKSGEARLMMGPASIVKALCQ